MLANSVITDIGYAIVILVILVQVSRRRDSCRSAACTHGVLAVSP